MEGCAPVQPCSNNDYIQGTLATVEEGSGVHARMQRRLRPATCGGLRSCAAVFKQRLYSRNPGNGCAGAQPSRFAGRGGTPALLRPKISTKNQSRRFRGRNQEIPRLQTTTTKLFRFRGNARSNSDIRIVVVIVDAIRAQSAVREVERAARATNPVGVGVLTIPPKQRLTRGNPM
jgi:hypothetical protein